MVKLLQPQEVEVFYILPAIRKALATEWKKQGKSQKEIAKLLGVTDAAVSQYLSSKRATALDENPVLHEAIEEAAKNIVDQATLIRETQRIIHLLRKERVICKIHEEYGGVPKNCKACFE